MWTPRRQHSHEGLRYETDVIDAEWDVIEPLIRAIRANDTLAGRLAFDGSERIRSKQHRRTAMERFGSGQMITRRLRDALSNVSGARHLGEESKPIGPQSRPGGSSGCCSLSRFLRLIRRCPAR